ncbi:hypothetical protein, partial [Pseudomonas viridiflava]
LSANAVFQPLHMRRMYRPFRGQTERRPVRSHKIEFLQWVTGCLIRGGLPAMESTWCIRRTASSLIAGKPPPTVKYLPRENRSVQDVREFTFKRAQGLKFSRFVRIA